jgi:hypothetical protein
VCALLALQQFRMTLIYMNILRSRVSGHLAAPQPALIHTALLDALKYASFTIVFFGVQWPIFVTYLLAVLLVKSGLDFFLAVFHVGRFGDVQLTAKGQAYTAALELVPCAFYLLPRRGGNLGLVPWMVSTIASIKSIQRTGRLISTCHGRDFRKSHENQKG